jgi:isopentenyl diphosphate isomerase/L-lactate dehydrogenase-like FMN-dependent dehydrogenase
VKTPDELLTIQEIVNAARIRLSPQVWDYSCGGADTETTLRRNRSAFDHLAFRPRVLSGVGKPDVSTTFLGHELSLPVMLAPVGSIARFHPDGALACARVAERAGTISFVGTLASPSLEEVERGASCPSIFQLYVYGDRRWVERLVRRIEGASYSAICLTVDLAAYGRRERDLHNRFFPRESIERPNLGAAYEAASLVVRDEYNAGLSWEDLAWLRELTDLPLMLKGILSPEDAELAVEHGVDAVYVSNHGGRQLDHAPATIEVLPEIVEAVGGKAEVVADSGFMRGTDVVKALAIGAKAVAIGKLTVWGLAAGGEEALLRTLELLKTEIATTMANIGAKRVTDLGPRSLRPSPPPDPAPWPVGSSLPASVARVTEPSLEA